MTPVTRVPERRRCRWYSNDLAVGAEEAAEEEGPPRYEEFIEPCRCTQDEEEDSNLQLDAPQHFHIHHHLTCCVCTS